MTSAAGAASRRPFTLAWLALAVLPLAAGTVVITRLHKLHLARLASEWSAKGATALHAGRPAEAVDDFRSAMMYAREDRALRLQLARALVEAGRGAQARGYLLMLWEDEPGNGPVNLELGRIAARNRNVAEAIRYYHGAIEGAWQADAEQRRRNARFELVDYLISQGEAGRARPDLIALTADLPEGTPGQMQIAGVLARAGLYSSAQTIYEDILHSTPNDVAALTGAGEAAFQQADYRVAARHLGRAIARGATAPDIARDAEVAQLVLDMDPWQRRLGVAGRAARAARAFTVTTTRLASCSAAHPDARQLAPLTSAAAVLSPHATPRYLARHPDDIDVIMDTVFDIEIATARACGDPTGPDRALYLMAATRKSER